ncbi:MAG: helix-turn-helix domain-containing protein [Oscillospiraceae bacterium]|nr:helix-turn-helix domain-containing protein [Oscillospiraceae bacterium]
MYRRIRDFREDKDLRQEDIAQYLHCTQRSYSRYECGESDIPTDVLIKLADFHNTTIDYLLERTDSPEPLPKPKRRR